MLEKMRSFISEQLNCDESEINPETDFRVMTLEEEYSMEIPPEELQTLNTVGDVIEYLKAHGIEE